MPAVYDKIIEPHDNEKDAIAFLCDNLPDGYMVIAGINVPNESRDRDIDVIVLAPHAIYVVELKHWYGEMSGNAGTWYWPDRSAHPSPLNQAQRNAQILATALHKYNPNLGDLYCQSVVFFTGDKIFWSKVNDNEKRKRRLRTKATIIPFLTDPNNLDEPEKARNCTPYFSLISTGLRTGFSKVEQVQSYRIRGILWATGDYVMYEASQQGQTEPSKLLRATHLDKRTTGTGALVNYQEHFRTEWKAAQRLKSAVNDPFGGKQFIADADEPFWDDATDLYVRPLAYRPGKPLSFARRPIEPKEVYKLAEKLCRALAFLHGAGVIHRNLHPGNILWNAEHGIPTLLNLDWAGFLDAERTTKNLQNPISRMQFEADVIQARYYAPERSIGKGTDTYAVDLYSLGVIIWELLSGKQARTGQPPYAQADLDALKLPVEVANLIATYTKVDPLQRTTIPLEKAVEIFSDLQTFPNALPKLKPGFIFDNAYTIIRQLKDTNNSVTYLGKSNIDEEEQVVIKLLRSPDGQTARVELVSCMRLMKSLDQHWTSRYVKAGEIYSLNGKQVSPRTPDARKVHFLVQEYIPGQTLRDYIRLGTLREEQKLYLAKGITGALAAIHQSGYIHRDIKPENFIVTPDPAVQEGGLAIRIIDFGLSRRVEEAAATEGYSTGYLPPEIRADLSRPWTQAGDVWSAARVILEMLEIPPAALQPDGEGEGPTQPEKLAGLLQFLRHNLSETPQERCENGTVMCQALERILDELGKVTVQLEENEQEKEGEGAASTDTHEEQTADGSKEPDHGTLGGDVPVAPALSQIENRPTQWLEARAILDEISGDLRKNRQHPYPEFNALLLEPYKKLEALLKEGTGPQDAERADLSTTLDGLRRALINQTRAGFEASLQQVEASRQREMWEARARDASDWLEAFDQLGVRVGSDGQRLVQANLRFSIWEKAQSLYEDIHKQLAAPGALKDNSANLRPKGEQALTDLKSILRDIATNYALPGDDPRQVDIQHWLDLLEEELQPFIIKTSTEQSIAVSSNFAEQYELLNKEKQLGFATQNYFTSEIAAETPEERVLETKQAMPIDEALRICKARWINWARRKITAYINTIFERGFKETGPFTENPKDIKDRLEEEVRRVSLSWDELGKATYNDYRATADALDRAGRTAGGYNARLVAVDIAQPDHVAALRQLEEVGQEVLAEAPFLQSEYDTRHMTVMNSVTAWLDKKVSSLLSEFAHDPGLAAKKAAEIVDLIRAMPQLKPWAARLSAIERNGMRLSIDIPLIQQEIRSQHYDTARKKAQVQVDGLTKEKLPIPVELSACRREIDLIEQPQASTDDALSRAATLEPGIQQAYTTGLYSAQLQKSVSDALSEIEGLARQLTALHQVNADLSGIQKLAERLTESAQILSLHQQFIALNLELSRSAGANLAKAEEWLGDLQKSSQLQAAGIPLDQLSGLSTSLSELKNKDSRVSAWVQDASRSAGQPLNVLLDLFDRAEEINQLPTSQGAARSSAMTLLGRVLIRRANEFAQRFSAKPDQGELELAKRLLEWCKTQQPDLQDELDGAIHEAVARAYMQSTPPDLPAAYKSWAAAERAGRRSAAQHELALLKLLALVSALRDSERTYLRHALSNDILKQDRDLKLLDFQMRMKQISGEYEAAGGKPEQKGVLEMTRLVGEISKATGYDEGGEDHGALPEENPLGSFWQAHGYERLLGKLRTHLPTNLALLFDELRYRKSLYTAIASSSEKLNEQARLKELDMAIQQASQYIEKKMWREDRWENLLRKQSRLDGLYVRLWEAQVERVLNELRTWKEVYTQQNGLRGWIIKNDPNPGSADIVNDHLYLSQAYQDIFSRCNYLESAPCLQSLGADEDKARKHAEDYTALRAYTADITETMPPYVNALCAPQLQGVFALAFPGASSIQNPLQQRIQEFTNLNNDNNRRVFADNIRAVMVLFEEVKTNAQRLLLLDNATARDLDEFINRHLRIGSAQPGALANYPLYNAIIQKLTEIKNKRNDILSVLQKVKLAGDLDNQPCQPTPLASGVVQMMQIDPLYRAGMAPIDWAQLQVARLFEEDRADDSGWKYAIQYAEHSGPKALDFLAKEAGLLSTLRAALAQLDALLPPSITNDSLASLERMGFHLQIDQARHADALNTWGAWFGVKLPNGGTSIQEWCNAWLQWRQQQSGWEAVFAFYQAQAGSPLIPIGSPATERNPQMDQQSILGLVLKVCKVIENAQPTTQNLAQSSCTRRKLVDEINLYQQRLIDLTQKSLCPLVKLEARRSAWQSAVSQLEQAQSAWIVAASKRWPFGGKRQLEQATIERNSTICRCCSIAPADDTNQHTYQMACATDPLRTQHCGRFIRFNDPNC